MGRMTVLTWSGCRNVRDLGGLPTHDGARTRDRALVRADSLTRLDEAGQRALAAYGVSRIVDLRAEHETADPPHPYAGQAVYRSVPWVDVDREPPRDPSAERGLAGDLPRQPGPQRRAGRRRRCAPSSRRLPARWWCTAPAARTAPGCSSRVLLETVGVPRAVVVEDYAVSAEHLGIADDPRDLGAATAGPGGDLRLVAPGDADRRARAPRRDVRRGAVLPARRLRPGRAELAAVRARLVD